MILSCERNYILEIVSFAHEAIFLSQNLVSILVFTNSSPICQINAVEYTITNEFHYQAELGTVHAVKVYCSTR